MAQTAYYAEEKKFLEVAGNGRPILIGHASITGFAFRVEVVEESHHVPMEAVSSVPEKTGCTSNSRRQLPDSPAFANRSGLSGDFVVMTCSIRTAFGSR